MEALRKTLAYQVFPLHALQVFLIPGCGIKWIFASDADC